MLVLFSFWNCERDDICAAATPTTPHLIIRFYDINVRAETKTVRHLSINADNHPSYIVYDRTIDSVIVPLKIEGLNQVNTTKLLLTKDVDYDLDENPATGSNTDIIEVNYTPELIYVSRACGYKSVFNNVSTNNVTDDNNWIIDVEVIKDTINNEDAAHINIYH